MLIWIYVLHTYLSGCNMRDLINTYVCTHFLRAIWCSQLTPEQIIDFIHHSLTQYHSVVFGYTAIVNAIALAIDICTTKDIMDKGSLYRRRRNPDRGDCARQRRRRGGDRTTPWACRSVDHLVPRFPLVHKASSQSRRNTTRNKSHNSTFWFSFLSLRTCRARFF